MIDLYFWTTPNAYKVSILLEELAQPYRVVPVHIGKGANVTAGSVVTEDVPAGGLAFGRARQVTKKGRAAPLRAKLKARAAAAKRAKKK